MAATAPSAAPAQAQDVSSEVSASCTGGLGRITLRRERQVNALGAEHVEAVKAALLGWAAPGSGAVAVLLDSSSPKAFCSGAHATAAQRALACISSEHGAAARSFLEASMCSSNSSLQQ